MDRSTPMSNPRNIRRASRTVHSDREDSVDSARGISFPPRSVSAFSTTPGPPRAQLYTFEEDAISEEPLAVQKLQAELEVAEAELKAARLKYQYIQAREKAENEAKYGGTGTENEPHTFN